MGARKRTTARRRGSPRSVPSDCRVSLAQINPTLGDLEANLEIHLEWIARAKKQKSEIVIFPELSLTGYFLRDLTQEVALSIDAPPVQKLVALSKGISILFGFVEESPDHLFYNTCVFAEDGRILHKHRKVYLPTYGIFEEKRYMAAGDRFQSFDSKRGKFGILICEDLWHVSSGYLYFLQGVDAILCPSNSPGRGIAEEGSEVQTARVWNTLLTAQSYYFNVYSVFCNRVGFEDGVLFWGGSKIVSPFGRIVAASKSLDPDLVKGKIAKPKTEAVEGELSLSALRRSRIFAPLRRDEREFLFRKELQRILGGSSGD